MAAAFTGYLSRVRGAEPRRGLLRVSMTSERVMRGRYVYVLAGCDQCHSPRDWTRFAGPVLPLYRGEGVELPREPGLPERVVSGNLTTDRETGLGGVGWREDSGHSGRNRPPRPAPGSDHALPPLPMDER